MFSLFLKKQKQQKRKSKQTNKISKTLFCVGRLLLGMEPAQNVVDTHRATTFGENGFSLSHQVIIENFLVRDGTWCLFPVLSAGSLWMTFLFECLQIARFLMSGLLLLELWPLHKALGIQHSSLSAVTTLSGSFQRWGKWVLERLNYVLKIMIT